MRPVVAADFWAVIAALAGVAAVLVAVQVYRLQCRRELKSVSYEVTNRPLIQIGPEARDKVQILYEGQDVADVHLIQIVLWNTGSAPILRTDFERSATVALPKRTAPLSSTLTAVGEPDSLRPQVALADGCISLAPTLINPGDRITIGVLVGGFATSDRNVDVDVRIVGVPDAVEAIDRARATLTSRQRRGTLLLAVAALGAVGVFVAIASYVASVRDELQSDHPAHRFTRVELAAGAGVCGVIAARDTERLVVIAQDTGQVRLIPVSGIRRIRASSC